LDAYKYRTSGFNRTNKKVVTFTTADGLPDNEFNGFASTKAVSGLLYFSTLNGIISVNPALIKQNSYSAPVALTVFKAASMDKLKSDSFYNTYNTDTFILPAGYNSISIKFSALTFAASSKVKYKVRLYGYDKKWTLLNDDNEIDYKKLPPGTYSFKVVATTDTNNWNKPTKTVNITVEAMWYQTGWWKLIVALIVVLVIYTTYRFRVRQLKKEQKIRT
jgi:hypothetical protein